MPTRSRVSIPDNGSQAIDRKRDGCTSLYEPRENFHALCFCPYPCNNRRRFTSHLVVRIDTSCLRELRSMQCSQIMNLPVSCPEDSMLIALTVLEIRRADN